MNKFTMIFRGEGHDIEGYVESGDPSVGLFGGGFIAEKIVRISDGYVFSDDDFDRMSDAEQEEIDKYFWSIQPPDVDPPEEDMEDWEEYKERPLDPNDLPPSVRDLYFDEQDDQFEVDGP